MRTSILAEIIHPKTKNTHRNRNMLAVTKSPDSLRSAVEALAGVLVDVTLRISPAGFDLRQLDSTGSTFVALSFPAAKWEKWESTAHAHYGINVPSLAKVLRTTKNAKEIELKVVDPAKMTITASGQGIKTTHVVNLLDYTLTDVKVPEVDYPLELDVSTKTFKRIVRDLGSLADQMNLRQVEGGILFTATGPFTEQQVLLHEGEFLAFSNDELEEVTGPYSLRILSLFARSADNDLVRIRAKPGMPLVLEYATELGAVLFATSPL